MKTPDDALTLTQQESLALSLCRWDLPKAEGEWLAALLHESELLPVHDAIDFAWVINEAWKVGQRRAAIALRAFTFLVQPRNWRLIGERHREFEPPSTTQQRAFVDACKRDNVDIGREFLKDIRNPGYVSELRNDPRSLFETGALQPADYIQIDKLLLFGRHDIFKPNVETEEEADAANEDPTRVRLWDVLDRPSLIEYLKVHFQSASDERLAFLTRGLINELHPYYGGRRYTDLPQNADLRDWIVAYVQERLGDDPRKAHPDLRRTWLEMWIGLWFMSPNEELADEARVKLGCEIAELELGLLRKVAREANTSLVTEEMNNRVPTIRACADCLFEFKSLWNAMRPFLLLFRSLTVPGVASDLRYWVIDGLGEQPPEPWSAIVGNLIDHFHGHAYRELKVDSELEELRTKLARYCLDRLKTSKDRAGPVETSAAWRLGYIHAVKELRVNPEGAGHHTLHHVASADPDQSVRDAANDLYPIMRRSPKPNGISPRKLVLAAIWELRKAHLLDLGAPFDAEAALNTQKEEVRRATPPMKFPNEIFDIPRNPTVT